MGYRNYYALGVVICNNLSKIWVCSFSHISFNVTCVLQVMLKYIMLTWIPHKLMMLEKGDSDTNQSENTSIIFSRLDLLLFYLLHTRSYMNIN